MAEVAQKAAAGSRLVFDNIKSVVVPASAAVLPAFRAAGSALRPLWDVVKFEIFRDFFQIISLFFTGLANRLPSSFRTFWGNVTYVFSLCWSCWINDVYAKNRTTFSLVFFLIKFVIAFLVSVIFYHRYRTYDPDDDQQGLDLTKWANRSRFQYKFAKYSALVLTTLYLPLVRDVLEIFTCDLGFVGLTDTCYQGTHVVLIVCSVICVLVYILPMPFVFYFIIKKYKPQERLYDEEGKLRAGAVAYTDLDYKKDLEKDHSPYLSLYEGYERKWAHYKVIVMMIKVALVLPAVVMSTTNTVGNRIPANDDADITSYDKHLLLGQSIVTLAILCVYGAATWAARPFLDPSDDWLDGISRFCTMGTALFGLLTYVTSTNFIFALMLNLLVAVSSVTMILMIIGNTQYVRKATKKFLQRIDLTPSRVNMGKPLVFSEDLDLKRERKVRIWHEFWDVLFVQDKTLRIPHDKQEDRDEKEYIPMKLDFQLGNTPPYLLNFKGSVGERHRECVEIASKESLASYEAAMWYARQINTNPAYAGLYDDMRKAILSLTGLDVYWNGPVEAAAKGAAGSQKARATKPNRSATCFGKMYIIPFPFTAVVYMDDVNEYVLFSLAPVVSGVTRNVQQAIAEFMEFVKLNFDPEIVRRKQVRVSLRCFDQERVEFFYQCWKSKSKQRQVGRDEQGNAKYETYTVKVLFTFKNGTFAIARDAKTTVWNDSLTRQDVNMARGFQCSLHYHDGEGVDSEGQHWRNEQQSIGHAELGITSEFHQTEQLTRLFGRNRHILDPRYPALCDQYQRYRDHYFNEFRNKEAVLSYAFWYFVYNNDRISSDELTAVLTGCERNDVVRDIVKSQAGSLSMVYSKLAYYNSHPSVAFWFVFWHDFWCLNRDLKVVEDAKDFLDPFNAAAICYHPMTRAELEPMLVDRGLRVGNGEGSCFGARGGFLGNKILDRLFERMDSLSQGQPLDADGNVVEQKVSAATSELVSNGQLVQNYQYAADFFQRSLLVPPFHRTHSGAGVSDADVLAAEQKAQAAPAMPPMDSARQWQGQPERQPLLAAGAVQPYGGGVSYQPNGPMQPSYHGGAMAAQPPMMGVSYAGTGAGYSMSTPLPGQPMIHGAPSYVHAHGQPQPHMQPPPVYMPPAQHGVPQGGLMAMARHARHHQQHQ